MRNKRTSKMMCLSLPTKQRHHQRIRTTKQGGQYDKEGSALTLKETMRESKR
jgi:hypothetical protein